MEKGEKIDSAVKMAKRAATLKYEDLSEHEVSCAKQSIMDCLGVMIAATTLGSKCLDVVEMVKKAGGTEEASIIGQSGKYPADWAAIANGGLAHTLDFDDATSIGGNHPAAAALPAALACIEKKGGASGKELIEAFVAGSDMVVRIGYASPTAIGEMGWLAPQLDGAYGSAVAAGKALGFDEEKMINCIGLMLQQTSGTKQVLNEGGNDCRELYQCFAHRHGMFAAMLAEIGIRGPRDSFEGANGLYKMYFEGKGATNYEMLDVDENSPWMCTEAEYKIWCSCRRSHGFIDGIRQLMKKHDFTGDDVKKVTVGVGMLGRSLCEPRETRYTPQVAADARFSIPFTVANALVFGDVTLDNFTEEGMHNPQVLKMAEKIEWYADEEILAETTSAESAKITVELNNGETYYIKIGEPLGSLENPLKDEDLIGKFKNCCKHAAKPMSEETVNKLVDLCMNLEKVEDVRDIIALCC